MIGLQKYFVLLSLLILVLALLAQYFFTLSKPMVIAIFGVSFAATVLIYKRNGN